MFNLWRIFEGIKSAAARNGAKVPYDRKSIAGAGARCMEALLGVRHQMRHRRWALMGKVSGPMNGLHPQKLGNPLCCGGRIFVVYTEFNDHCSKASRQECNGMAAGPGYIEQGIGICKGCTGFKLEEYNTRRVRGVRIPGTGDRVPGRRCSAHAEKDQRSMNGKPSLSIKSYGRLIGGVAHKRIAGCRRSTCAARYGGIEPNRQSHKDGISTKRKLVKFRDMDPVGMRVSQGICQMGKPKIGGLASL
ncbi:hypothetical protein DFH06DRAFT_1141074 [Mycena polygramma]|nr:hypothetical protein DFH06DRAFT_1141074 [Mycena polygramma]